MHCRVGGGPAGELSGAGKRQKLWRTAHSVHSPLEGSPKGFQHVLPGGALPPCIGSTLQAVGCGPLGSPTPS